MKLDHIDHGQAFDFGRTSSDYARYRDIYPKSMYDKLIAYGVGRPGQEILDLGSGTAILPLNLAYTGAVFTATDIAENQIKTGRSLARERRINNIRFAVCSAEDTGFADDSFDAVTAVQCFPYFDADRAAAEIRRVLRPGGVFCKIMMDWLPREDAIIAEMIRVVQEYNPAWREDGFSTEAYTFPGWAQGRFILQSAEQYDEALRFTRESWLGRVRTCRGVGAGLPEDTVAAFTDRYREILSQYDEPLMLRHRIRIEIYEVIK